mmetsp:Transcript_21872/g.46723  ORF Transcript_21872/g.46723 Transcript_21872/m.46723 type:complete len:455 (+) Transcript_21872:201-1565(+)
MPATLKRRPSLARIKHTPEGRKQICENFAVWCAEQFSTLVAVWRHLDKDWKMVLHRDIFIEGIQALGFPGDAGDLWAALDRDYSNSITLLEFSPDATLELAQFKQWVTGHFGSAAAAITEMDKDGDGQVSLDEFRRFCFKEGFPSHLKGSLDMLFQALAESHNDAEGQNDLPSISLKQLSCIDRWDCPQFLYVLPDHHAKLRFKRAVLQHFQQNSILAWRLALDRDGAMQVRSENWLSLCVEMASEYGIREATWDDEELLAVYNSLDGRRCGWFSLKDWDHHGYTALTEFTLWAKEAFGSIEYLVRTFGDEDGCLGLQDFAGCTRQLGLSFEDLELIFEALAGDRSGLLEWMKIKLEDIAWLDAWDPAKEVHDTILGDRFIKHKADLKAKQRLEVAAFARTYGTTLIRRRTPGKSGILPEVRSRSKSSTSGSLNSSRGRTRYSLLQESLRALPS